MGRGGGAFPGQRIHPQRQVHRRTAHRVALGQKCGEQRRTRTAARDHMRQTRVQGQLGQFAAMVGDAARVIQRTEHAQDRLCFGQTARMGWGDKT